MRILITGAAGFIGSAICQKLKKKAKIIVGIDSLNNYYSLKLKKLRLKKTIEELNKKFQFYKTNLKNYKNLEKIFIKHKFDIVINMAAQAGVRYSIENPKSYIESNIIGFYNILELSKKYKVKHLVYASSSSVYGEEKKFPIKEKRCAYKPIQLYAATKLSNEMMAHAYSSLFKLKTTGLRFFTVYGPWGRPDMFLFKFVSSVLNNKKVSIYNFGKHSRDFTYIDDITNGIIKATFNKKFTSKEEKKIPFRVFNLGSGQSINILKFIKAIENSLKKKAKKVFLSLQKGDIYKTHADISLAKKILRYKPIVNYKSGIKKFIDWYLINEKKL